jgi:quinol monooxygenase YgiN
MLLLSVKYTARPGGGENFVREITDSGILDTVRAEDGCISYDYFFSTESRDTVLLIEKWASPEQQEAHIQSAHMAELMNIKEKYILNTAVEKAVL